MKRIWRAFGRVCVWLFCAVWSLTVAHMLVDLSVRALTPDPAPTADQFAAAVVGLAILICIGMVLAFSSDAAMPQSIEVQPEALGAARDDYNLFSLPEPHDPSSCCPACHAPMELAARSDDWKVVTKRELFRCPQGHLWWREISLDAPDVQFPWQPCRSTSEGLDALSA